MANGGKPNRPLRPRGGSGPGTRRRRVVIDHPHELALRARVQPLIANLYNSKVAR